MKHYYATDLGTVCISEHDRRTIELASDIRSAGLTDRYAEPLERADALLLDIFRVVARFKCDQGAGY